MEIEKSEKTGVCFGVRRAIDIVERTARERDGVETLGAVVHNRQVLERLAELGVRVAKGVDEIQGSAVVVSAHGAGPEVLRDIQARNIEIIDTTCPFVHRAQKAARRLAESGFFVVIYGDATHAEVKGILGCAGGRGVATQDERVIARLDPLPRRLGVLSQTTQVPDQFTQFIKRLIESTFTRDSELRVIDTICHDIRERQAAAVALAHKVDLMLVVGGRNSANTNRLAQLCSPVTPTYLIETADEVQPSWLRGRQHVGVTAGASTDEPTIDEVLTRLEAMSRV